MREILLVAQQEEFSTGGLNGEEVTMNQVIVLQYRLRYLLGSLVVGVHLPYCYRQRVCIIVLVAEYIDNTPSGTHHKRVVQLHLLVAERRPCAAVPQLESRVIVIPVSTHQYVVIHTRGNPGTEGSCRIHVSRRRKCVSSGVVDVAHRTLAHTPSVAEATADQEASIRQSHTGTTIVRVVDADTLPCTIVQALGRRSQLKVSGVTTHDHDVAGRSDKTGMTTTWGLHAGQLFIL